MRKKQSTNAVTLEKPIDTKWEFGQRFVFRLRRVTVPVEFRGLWNLELLDEHGQVMKVISDADALNFCIDNMMGELEDAGF